MIALLALASAAPLSEDVADRLDDQALDLLEGPAGCWELVGKARWDWRFSRFGQNEGDAVFAGKLVDGVWTAFHLFPTGERQSRRKEVEVHHYVAENRFRPLIGDLAGNRVEEGAVKSDDSPVNALDAMFDEISSNVWTSEVSQGADGAAYVTRRVAIDGGEEAMLVARFPNIDGPPTGLDLDIEKGFRVKGAPVGTRVAPGATARIRGKVIDGVLVPSAEQFAFTVKWMGLAFNGSQSIRYTKVTRCESSASPPPP